MSSINDIDCNFSGNSVSIDVKNSDTRFRTLQYECVWNLDDGSTKKINGSVGLNAGQSSKVASDTTTSPVSSVEAKSLIEI